MGGGGRGGGGDLPTVVVRGTPVPAPRGALLTRLSTRRGPLEVHAAGGNDRVVVPEGLAAYTLHAGRRVSWHLPARAPSEAEADHFVAAVIPWALASGSGTPVLHAATLVGPTGSVLLVGRSGAGKSTLSTALHRRLGWPLLGDDAAVLRLAGGEAQVLSCSREVRLWDDAGKLLGLDGGIPLPRYGTKSRHPLAGPADRPVPVAAVILVNSRPEPDRATGGPAPAALAVMRPVDGLLLLRAGLMRTALIPVGDAAREFDFLTRWMRGVTFATLDYPHRPTALDEASRLIADFAVGAAPGTAGPGPATGPAAG
ncbi:AAA family ATPase [Pseudofrankia inefficax]|uniref:AAA ATPase n=1 Tax=Pseudofrankia inefficax (strain DSM 45817 / CECT 9037 / DDB 130130 / EuI1c) TaxID=298654 RepID=E3IWV0_PSEI1|nr:AAA family ATPase [Pseudofrankia inefficax]ADP82574.1 AAA ATPase [Pseudofrankia inefficax]